MTDPVPDPAPEVPADEDEGRLQRVHPLSPLLRGGLVMVALAFAAGRQLVEGQGFNWPLPIVGAIIAAVVLWAALSWWTTRFRLGTHSLRIESGILARRSRRIRLDRVQAVEVQQPLLARLFGMAELQIETAGGGTEAALAFLPHAHALALRQELLDRAGAQREPAVQGADGSALPADETSAGGAPEPTVLHVVPPALLLVSQLVRTGPLVATGATALAVGASVYVGNQPLGLALLLPMGLAVVGSIVNGFVAQYGFVLSRTTRGLAVRAGLLNVRSQAIPVDRVQGVVVVEPVVWRWLGWCEVQVTVAGVRSRGDDEARFTSTLVPVIERDAGARLAIDALGSGGPSATPLHSPPKRARWLDPVGWPVLRLGTGAGQVVTRRGLLVRRTDVVPRHKVQSCAVVQGPLQRRLGLASLHVHLPSGPVDAEGRHREAGEAWGLALTLPTDAPLPAGRDVPPPV